MKKEVTITNYIKHNYRDYALYVLTSRGIPAFEDSLTPVQRIIISNAKNKYEKTLSLVGSCFSDNYHHGNASCESAINRLARTYDCSQSILVGDGFFGNKVNQYAASPRYTSIKISPEASKIISEYNFLNKKDSTDSYLPLNLRVPLGLCLPIIGIAVGYRTFILPRKLKDVQDFLDDKRKECKPWFNDFNGKIKKVKDLENAWLFEGEYELDERNKTIHIKSIPPMTKYDSFVKKLNKLILEYDVDIENNSKDEVNIKIKLKHDWDILKDKIIKLTKIIIKEQIIFIKDKHVLEYNSIEDYLLDFKVKNLFMEGSKQEYDINICSDELDYLRAKKEFYLFMLGNKRTEAEIKEFLKPYNIKIQTRLDNIKATKLNKNEYSNVLVKIKETEAEIIKLKSEYKKYCKMLDKVDTTLHNKVSDFGELFDDEVKVLNDIEIYDPFEELIVEEE